MASEILKLAQEHEPYRARTGNPNGEWSKDDCWRTAVRDTSAKISLWATGGEDMQILKAAFLKVFNASVLQEGAIQELVWENSGHDEATRVGYRPIWGPEDRARNSHSLRHMTSVTVDNSDGNLLQKLRDVVKEAKVGEIVTDDSIVVRKAKDSPSPQF